MLKSLKVAAALAASIGVSLASASAQSSNNVLGSGGMMNLISASDVGSIMSELGVTTVLKPRPGGAPFIEASTPGGGRFLFHLVACQDEQQLIGCQSVFVTTALSNTGVAYDDLNNFNGNASVTTAVNVPSQQLIAFGRHILVIGGHSRDLFAATVALFLHDVGTFASARTSTNSVSFRSPRPPRSKIGEVQSVAIPEGPATVFGFGDISAEVAAAISNTNDVSFSVDYQPASSAEQ